MGTMSGKKIVVAVDGSDASRDALRFGMQIAADLGCTATAVIAIQTRMPGYRAAYFSFVDRHILTELRQFAADVAAETRRVAAVSDNTPPETLILESDKDIYEQIVDFLAANPDVGILVVGSYGHGVRERLILGSTTERLILEIARRQMKTPVLVVP